MALATATVTSLLQQALQMGDAAQVINLLSPTASQAAVSQAIAPLAPFLSKGQVYAVALCVANSPSKPWTNPSLNDAAKLALLNGVAGALAANELNNTTGTSNALSGNLTTWLAANIS
jgi:hypothetical protein